MVRIAWCGVGIACFPQRKLPNFPTIPVAFPRESCPIFLPSLVGKLGSFLWEKLGSFLWGKLGSFLWGKQVIPTLHHAILAINVDIF